MEVFTIHHLNFAYPEQEKNAISDLTLLLLSLGGVGKRARAVTYGGAYWYRFGVCCVCLLLAALIELWLVPQFLLLAAR